MICVAQLPTCDANPNCASLPCLCDANQGTQIVLFLLVYTPSRTLGVVLLGSITNLGGGVWSNIVLATDLFQGISYASIVMKGNDLK